MSIIWRRNELRWTSTLKYVVAALHIHRFFINFRVSVYANEALLNSKKSVSFWNSLRIQARAMHQKCSNGGLSGQQANVLKYCTYNMLLYSYLEMRESFVTTPTITCPGLRALTLNANIDCRSCAVQSPEPPPPLLASPAPRNPYRKLSGESGCGWGCGRHMGEGSLAMTARPLGASVCGDSGESWYTKCTSDSSGAHGEEFANEPEFEESFAGAPVSLHTQHTIYE